MDSPTPIIALEGVTRRYLMGREQIVALNDVQLRIAQNDYVALTGASGSGKSTMMHVLGCLDRADQGKYLLDGRDVTSLDDNALARVRNERIGFVFQTFNLIPTMDARANVMQPLIYRHVPYNERRRLAALALDRVGLSDRMNFMPNQLSGGQRQRVAIARALVTSPSIILADEPTGNLDSVNSSMIMDIFDNLHAEGRTVIIVTHEAEVADHCRRIVRLKDGRVVQDS